MHNLKANFDIFIGLTKSYFSDRIKEFDNLESNQFNINFEKRFDLIKAFSESSDHQQKA